MISLNVYYFLATAALSYQPYLKSVNFLNSYPQNYNILYHIDPYGYLLLLENTIVILTVINCNLYKYYDSYTSLHINRFIKNFGNSQLTLIFVNFQYLRESLPFLRSNKTFVLSPFAKICQDLTHLLTR